MRESRRLSEYAKKKKADRAMFGFPWTSEHIKAFHICAGEIQSGRARGNASELARAIQTEVEYCILGTARCRELGIMNPWDETIPEPKLIRYILELYNRRERSSTAESSVTK